MEDKILDLAYYVVPKFGSDRIVLCNSPTHHHMLRLQGYNRRRIGRQMAFLQELNCCCRVPSGSVEVLGSSIRVLKKNGLHEWWTALAKYLRVNQGETKGLTRALYKWRSRWRIKQLNLFDIFHIFLHIPSYFPHISCKKKKACIYRYEMESRNQRKK